MSRRIVFKGDHGNVPPVVSPLLRTTHLVARSAFVCGLWVILGVFLAGGVLGVRAAELLEYGEPYIVSAACNLAEGGTLYAPVEDLPFLHNNYNPLVQTLVAPVLAHTGPAYWPQRTVTFVSVCSILLVVFVMVRRSTGSTFAATVAGLLPLSCGFVFPWFCVARVDAVAVLFSTLAVAWAARHRDRPLRIRGWFLVFGWVAFAAKQSVLAGVLGVLLDGALRGRFRESILLGGVFVLGCAAQMGLFNALTDGQYWLHAVSYNASHERLGIWPSEVPPWDMAKAIGPTLLLVFLMALPKLRRREDGLWMCWLGTSWVLSVILLRKSGTHVHYLLEPVAGLSVLGASAGFRWLSELHRKDSTRPWIVASLAFVLLAVSLFPLAHARTWQRVKGLRDLQERNDPVPREVLARIRQGPGPALLLSKTGSLAIQAQRRAIFDVADFVRLQELGLFRAEDRLIPLIADGKFSVIALPEDLPADAQAHFGGTSIRGLVPAVEQYYRRLPEELRDPKALGSASFWVPR